MLESGFVHVEQLKIGKYKISLKSPEDEYIKAQRQHFYEIAPYIDTLDQKNMFPNLSLKTSYL